MSVEILKSRISEYLHSKIAIFLGWVTSGGLIFDGTVKKVATAAPPEKATFLFLSLSDWQILVGIMFTLTMMIPKWYQFYKWLKVKLRKEN